MKKAVPAMCALPCFRNKACQVPGPLGFRAQGKRGSHAWVWLSPSLIKRRFDSAAMTATEAERRA